jgi:tRNA-dihydrouridine synthase
VIEELCEYIDRHREKLWICTNGEILKYVKAFRALEYSADGTMIRKPSSLDVWFQPAMGKTECIPAGRVWTGEE